MQAEAERVKSIEGRCLELQRMCDAMHDDRNRMSKELANGAAHMRSLEEQLNQMSIEKRQQDQTLLYIHAMKRGPAAAHLAQPPPMVAPPQPQPQQPTSPAIVMPRSAHEPNVAPAAGTFVCGLAAERLRHRRSRRRSTRRRRCGVCSLHTNLGHGGGRDQADADAYGQS